jgi:hypothetical protein
LQREVNVDEPKPITIRATPGPDAFPSDQLAPATARHARPSLCTVVAIPLATLGFSIALVPPLVKVR